jgi:sporulation protein YlmC with PRC-barrel domain
MSAGMETAAGWFALLATSIAALMTASNLGPRVTGWGFAVFTTGACAWAYVGLATHQTQLLWANIFLGAVDLFGVWRWLGRRARFNDASIAEEDCSEGKAGEPLFSASRLDGMPVRARDGVVIAHVTDALISRVDGEIAFLIIRTGGAAGLGETLHKLPWKDVQASSKTINTQLEASGFKRLSPAEVS